MKNLAKKQIAVMDIGSSKIRVLVYSISNINNMEITGFGETSYAGFLNGEFLEPEKLKDSVETALSRAQSNAKYIIKELYVGIPADFLVVKTKQLSTTYAIKRKIKDTDIFDIMDKGNDLKFSKETTLVASNPISFKVDGNKYIPDAIGHKTQNISALISYEYADNEFIRQFNVIFEDLGLLSVDYLSNPLAEFLTLLDDNARKDYAMIVDCGYITTHVLIGKNKGILNLNSFSVGGAHIMSDLAKVIKIGYDEAENLKRKAILNIDELIVKGGYEVAINDNSYEVPANIVEDIIKARIDMICTGINKSLEFSGIEYQKYYPVFLTGGGLSLIKGAKEYISKVLDRPVEILSSKLPEFSKPYHAQLLSLASLAAEKELFTSNSFLAKLMRKW